MGIKRLIYTVEIYKLWHHLTVRRIYGVNRRATTRGGPCCGGDPGGTSIHVAPSGSGIRRRCGLLMAKGDTFCQSFDYLT